MWEHISDEETHFVLHDEATGFEHHFEHGTFKRLVWFDNLDIREAWSDYRMSTYPFYRATRDGFFTYLGGMLIDPESAEDLHFCDDCEGPVTDELDLESVEDGDKQVCESCVLSYPECPDCAERYNDYSMTYIDSIGRSVCDGCYDHYTYCDYCDQSYHEDDDHYHDDDCNCESPVLEFSIPNNGDGMLAQDESTEVELPAGTISEQGLAQISRKIRDFSMAVHNRIYDDRGNYRNDYGSPEHKALVEEYQNWYNLSHDVVAKLDAKWQARDGNFTKRLSRHAFKTYGLKVPTEIISEVGNIANANSQGAKYNVEVTRDLNLSAAAFAHDDSCYWQSYASSRCTLKSNGAFGLRSFRGEGKDERAYDQNCDGRAWVMPLKYTEPEGEPKQDRFGFTIRTEPFRPTFESESPDAYIVFNGYGNLGGYAPARIMSHMTGMTYRKVGFYAGEAYINAGGYLIAPEEIAEKYTDGEVNLSIDPHSNLWNQEKVEVNAA